jgi:hypothetical protein
MLRGLLSPKAIVAIAVTLVLLAGLVAASLWMDHLSDRKRPMFAGIITMMDLQYDLLQQGKKPVLVRMHPHSPPVTIDGVSYRPPANVTVIVEQHGDDTCVQGNNQYHDRTRWYCIDLSLPQPKLGGLQ